MQLLGQLANIRCHFENLNFKKRIIKIEEIT